MCTSVLKNNWIIHTVGSVVQTNEAVVHATGHFMSVECVLPLKDILLS